MRQHPSPFYSIKFTIITVSITDEVVVIELTPNQHKFVNAMNIDDWIVTQEQA
jgi:hypothetical protein